MSLTEVSEGKRGGGDLRKKEVGEGGLGGIEGWETVVGMY